jgi:hypothetical protein
MVGVNTDPSFLQPFRKGPYTDIVLQTLKDLKKYISDQKIETLNDLLDRFPESEQRTGNKLTKPYIIEALWKLVFIYELDDFISAGNSVNII